MHSKWQVAVQVQLPDYEIRSHQLASYRSDATTLLLLRPTPCTSYMMIVLLVEGRSNQDPVLGQCALVASRTNTTSTINSSTSTTQEYQIYRHWRWLDLSSPRHCSLTAIAMHVSYCNVALKVNYEQYEMTFTSDRIYLGSTLSNCISQHDRDYKF